MTLQTTGQITLADIQTEFGGANPIGLSEYYAGGAYVQAGASGTNGAVPSTGAISLWNFYGVGALGSVTVGHAIITAKITDYYYGYNGAPADPTMTTQTLFGSITSGQTFNGATVKSIYSLGVSSTTAATTYRIMLSGNRASNFITGLQIAGTNIPMNSITAGTYDATNDQTFFTLTPTTVTTTLFGTTDGVAKSFKIS